MSAIRSLPGVNRTWRGQPNSVEIDPKTDMLRALSGLNENKQTLIAEV